MGEGEAEPRSNASPRRHTAAQRIVLVVNCLVVLACLVGAVGLVVAKHAAEQGKRVALPPLTEPPSTPAVITTHPTSSTDVVESTLPSTVETTATTEPPTTTTEAPRLEGVNYLVVGIDNNACIDPNSPYAGGIGQRTARLTDTIMMIRVVPSTKHAALLSFPRDLWVRVNGSMRRINTAYRRNDPTALRDTILNEFGIEVDHFIAVDFCAFMGLVDAVGGITLPLPYPVKDDGLGLYVPEAGCHTFAGDEALAYVRTRHLQYQAANGEWRNDLTSDFGRIARQQDFVRRVLTAAKQNLFDPSVIEGLYSAYVDHLVIDNTLTITDMRSLADVLRDVDTTAVRNYQFEATGRNISGQAVLIAKKTPTMTAILDIFRGRAPVAPGDPEQAALMAPLRSLTAPPTTIAAPQPESNPPRNAIVPDPLAQC